MKNKTLIFTAGEKPDNTYTNDDLLIVAENYEDSNYSAPWVIGHEAKSGDPAAGWIRALEYQEEDGVGQLWALSDFNPLGEKCINSGTHENKSVSFYKPDSPFNPTPGHWSLRHVALLGAEPPVLKDLGPIAVINYSEEEQVQDYVSYSCSCEKPKPLNYMDPKEQEASETEEKEDEIDLSETNKQMEELKAQLAMALKDAAEARAELNASKEANTALTVSSSIAPYYSEGRIAEDVLPEAALTAVVTKLTLGLTNYSETETPLTVIEGLLAVIGSQVTEPEYGETWENKDLPAPPKVDYSNGDELDALARKTATEYSLSYGQALSAVVTAKETAGDKVTNFSECLAEAVKVFRK